MAWETDDVVRSVRRYLNLTLEEDPPIWRLRVERREVRDDERPVGVVLSGPLTVLRARSAPEQGEVTSLLPVTVTLYPAAGANPRLARREADALRVRLWRLFAHGIPVVDGDGRVWSGPFSVPLWDYADVPMEGERTEPEDPHDVLLVEPESLTAEAIQDPDDQARFAVVCSVRVQVEAPGATRVTGAEPAVTSVEPAEDLAGSYGYDASG